MVKDMISGVESRVLVVDGLVIIVRSLFSSKPGARTISVTMTTSVNAETND